ITYRARSAVRDAAKALGFAPGQQDAWSKELDRWGGIPGPDEGAAVDGSAGARDLSAPEPVLALARRMADLPRHLGIHSGGMVICDRPVIEVCPTEWARMENRSVLQWDKDDCAAAGLVKFDLLGLGMLSALHGCLDLLRDHLGIEVDLAALPQGDGFYDVVAEEALIRPGPNEVGALNPYIRRRKGDDPVTLLDPLLEPSLTESLGAPLYQEQLVQMAIAVAGFSAREADQLRQAMAS